MYELHASLTPLLCLLHSILVLPDSASVVLRPSNYSVSLVVECAGEYLVFMPLQHLQLVACVHRPNTASLV
jgi:hypothetical protein